MHRERADSKPDENTTAAAAGADARALRASEQRWSLLVRLGDATRALSDPGEVVFAAMQVLREHLGADRCAWAEVEEDQDHFVFLGDAVAPGVPRVLGRFPISAFGAEALRVMRAGRSFWCTDAQAELPDRADRDAYQRTGICALIAAPIHEGGRLVAGTGVHMLTPRAWTADDLEIVREVTDRCWDAIQRARLQKALRASEERHRAIFDSQTEMLCRFRGDGTILFVNRAYAQARGTTKEALLGHNLWDFIPSPERPAVQAQLDRLTPDSPVLCIENRFETTAGARWTLWTNRALAFDEQGRLSEAQSSGIDITERKQVEEALRDADRRKDEFLAMLAHELRNPLAPIRTAAQILKRKGSLDATQTWAREVIERQTQHLTRLVDDLLDVSRITHGRIKLNREPLELATIIERAIETIRSLIEARRHQLRLVLPKEPLRLEGDLTRLVQVLGNLLHNAVKYTEDGGDIWVEATQEGGEAVIRVRDSGVGISAELLPHVFDLFKQADRSLDRAQGGLGIGLTLVQQLVLLHGGRVEARSGGPGQGSEFVVRLPAGVRSAAPAATAAQHAPLPSQTLLPLRVLVVEDNLDAAQMTALLLTQSGCTVQVVHDGLAALSAASSFLPEVVLCDIGLPKLNGYEVAARLRAQPRFQRTPLIAITGYGKEEDRRRAREAGFDYHLTKPVQPSLLEALLTTLAPGARATET